MNHKYSNKLINENSPYLLSHAHNPVNWYPWSDEAIEKAKKEDKPIFLSVGYAACHWCHVMEHESFENEDVANVLNENFVSIKVDREQRPDLDKIYMTFTTALTGQGGWPMSVFLTPDLKPFFAGTYFPPFDNFGRPGFMRLINEIANAYKNDKEAVLKSSKEIFEQLTANIKFQTTPSEMTEDDISNGVVQLMSNFDHVNGGFGGAPKFPHAIELRLFLREAVRNRDDRYLKAALKGLNKMADGGIYDHLGGGFARYSTDEKWLVPHFEKMLYDNGLLVEAFAEAYQITKDERYKIIISETLDFILDEMTDKSGGFYSALDADSEEVEGKFYVWDKNEIENILGDDSELFCSYYNITERGNFEGKNILNLTEKSHQIKNEQNDPEFEETINRCRQLLLEERSKRIRPLTDDKILTSWNGLALSAFCAGYKITKENRFLEAALKNARFVTGELLENNQLTHSYREGNKSNGLFLEDYAYYIKGLLDLFEIDNSVDRFKWLEIATGLAKSAVEHFMDESGELYLREPDRTDLIIRPQDETDSAIPSPGSILIQSLLKLERLSGETIFVEKAETALRTLSGKIKQIPHGMASALLALDFMLSDKIEIVVVGDSDERDKILNYLHHSYLPNHLIVVSEKGLEKLPVLEGREAKGSGLKVYLCKNSTCLSPVNRLEDLKKMLGTTE